MDDNSTPSPSHSSKGLLVFALVLQIGAIIWLALPNHNSSSAEYGWSIEGLISGFFELIADMILGFLKLLAVCCAMIVGAIIYVYDVMRSERISDKERTPWVIGTIFGGPIVQAIYYLRCIAFPKQAAS